MYGLLALVNEWVCQAKQTTPHAALATSATHLLGPTPAQCAWYHTFPGGERWRDGGRDLRVAPEGEWFIAQSVPYLGIIYVICVTEECNYALGRRRCGLVRLSAAYLCFSKTL